MALRPGWKSSLSRSGTRLEVNTEAAMKNIIARYRENSMRRFCHSSDWARLVLLGALLITFGAIALAAAFAIEMIPGYFGGSSALFSGVTIAFIISRIARTEIYSDWLWNAVFYLGVGLTLCKDESLDQILSSFLICILLLLSSAARVWIGLTAMRRAAAAWMLLSGIIAGLVPLWIIFARALHMAAAPEIAVALDSLLQGISIAGFGVSLRPVRHARKPDQVRL
jgi:uncharacterized membrane protein HdeD (DUF308 family)